MRQRVQSWPVPDPLKRAGVVMEIEGGRARVKYGPHITMCEWVAARDLKEGDAVNLVFIKTASGAWWEAEKVETPEAAGGQ